MLISSESFPEPGAAQRTNQGQGGTKELNNHYLFRKATFNLIKDKKYLFFSPEDVFLKLNPRYAAVDQLIGLLNGDEGSGDEDGAVGIEQDGGQEDGEDYDEEDEEEDDGEEEDHDDEEEIKKDLNYFTKWLCEIIL